jgi:hypothetical protein
MHHEVYDQGRQRQDLEQCLYDADELTGPEGPSRLSASITTGLARCLRED